MVAWLFDDRGRRLLLAEAMHAFADYLRAKAGALQSRHRRTGRLPRPDRGPCQSWPTDLQAARDSLFARRKPSHAAQARIDTLDRAAGRVRNRAVDSDADLEALRQAPAARADVAVERFRVRHGRRESERLTLALRSRHGHVVPLRQTEAGAKLLEAVGRHAARRRARRSNHPRLCRHYQQAGAGGNLYRPPWPSALDDATAAQRCRGRTVGPGPVPPGRRRAAWAVLAATSSAGAARPLRYAIRLSLAMTRRPGADPRPFRVSPMPTGSC